MLTPIRRRGIDAAKTVDPGGFWLTAIAAIDCSNRYENVGRKFESAPQSLRILEQSKPLKSVFRSFSIARRRSGSRPTATKQPSGTSRIGGSRLARKTGVGGDRTTRKYDERPGKLCFLRDSAT